MTLLLLALAHAQTATVRLAAGLPDGLGGSASLTALRPLEVEVGLGTTVIATSAFLRAGGAIPLHDARGADGRGALVEALVLGGYRHLWQQSGGADFDRNGVEGAVGGELTAWGAPHAALDVQLTAGMGTWVAAEGAGIYLVGRLGLGVAF